MATLLTSIPSLAFPYELDVLQFQADTDEYDVDIAISISGQTVLETTLVFDTDGLAEIDDMANFLIDHLKKQSTFTLKYGNTFAKITLLPCRFDMDETAASFCQKSFLTALQGPKVTSLGCKEFLSIYATSSEKGVVSLICTDKENNIHTFSSEISHGTNTGGIYTYDVSPALFATDSDKYDLVGYSVVVGSRKQSFILMPDTYGSRGVLFLNGFGCLESFNFCEVEKVTKPVRQSAMFGGKFRNYLVTEDTTYKGISRSLSEGEQMLADDLVHALQMWAQGSETELTITDNELKCVSSSEDMPRLSLTWRVVASRTPFVPVRPTRTFDVTFDKTFF